MNFAKSISFVACFPRNGWRGVEHDNIQWQEVRSKVLYPMMAVLSLSAFMTLVYEQEATLTGCIQYAIIDFAKYFFTFLVASYVLTGFFPMIVKGKHTANKVNVVIQYCMAIVIALNIIDNLLPIPFPYLKILYLYVFFVAWKAGDYLEIQEESNKKFLIIAAVMILLLPLAISFLLELGFNLN